MSWAVRFHSDVLSKDLPSLTPAARGAVLKAIRKRLTTAPESYGTPLRKELCGYWKLRVGDYRVIYRMDKDVVTVLVLKVGMRKDSRVYSEMAARLLRPSYLNPQTG